ncbi:hypothetical protein G6F68_020501 [Rhizopus microsporus]|nr:hypothetical protein G6F68_020501 [Rhizopus microsporus]
MYAEQLEKAGVIAAGAGKAMVDAYREKLDAGEVTTELAKVEKTPPSSPLFVDWPKLLEGKLSTRAWPRSTTTAARWPPARSRATGALPRTWPTPPC